MTRPHKIIYFVSFVNFNHKFSPRPSPKSLFNLLPLPIFFFHSSLSLASICHLHLSTTTILFPFRYFSLSFCFLYFWSLYFFSFIMSRFSSLSLSYPDPYKCVCPGSERLNLKVIKTVNFRCAIFVLLPLKEWLTVKLLMDRVSKMVLDSESHDAHDHTVFSHCSGSI